MKLPALKPRLRFSLRAILVLMTLVAAWFAYSANWLKQRQAFRTSADITFYKAWSHEDTPAAPGLLWLLGEPGFSNTSVKSKDGSVDVERLQSVYPESGMMVFGEGDFFPQVLKPKTKR